MTRYRYDPWGKQTLVSGSNSGIDQTRQGHTGHEMLDSGLTHMNGRVYDPVLARFISADPYVDNPFDLQSLNRYSYVNNNPLGFTDPSGYFKLFGKKWSWWRDKVVKPVVGAWLGYHLFIGAQWFIGSSLGGGVLGYTVGTIGAAAVAGATISLISTGSLDGWQYNALSAGLFYGAGDLGMSWNLAENSLGRAGLHAAAGCISASASGGSCGKGALSAGFSQYAGSNLGKYDSFVTRVVLGGTASVIGGGKFENGASTAAFGYLYNYLGHVHRRLTIVGGMNAGLSSDEAELLAWKVQEADLGTQGAADAHRHGMCSSATGSDACRAKVQDFINGEYSKGTLVGLGNAIHAVQDIAAGRHGYRYYGGLTKFIFSGEFIPHLAADLMLGDFRGVQFRQVSDITSSMIRRWVELNPNGFAGGK